MRVGFALALICLAALAPPETIKARIYGPRLKSLLSRPPVQWEVWTEDQFQRLTMTLNGQEVPAKYDRKSHLLTYQPEQPLAPGPYDVYCKAQIDGAVLEKRWSFQVNPSSLERIPDADPASRAAFDLVNELRVKLGLPPFTPCDTIFAACKAHTDYLVQNNNSGHYERLGTPGFLGQTPQERLWAYGYYGDSWEIVQCGANSAAEALRGLFDAPYHRLTLIQPGAPLAGCGNSAGALDFTSDMTKVSGTTLSPFDGQQDVPTSWSGREHPNPLRLHGAVGPTGFPIMLANYPPGGANLRVQTARLYLNGAAVECYLNTPDNDDELKTALVLIPKEALLPGTKYQVKVVAFRGTEDLSANWSFTTAPKR